MRFLFISGKGRAASIAYRLQQEGADVALYIHHPRYAGVFEGILKRRIAKAADLAEWLADTDGTTVVFDGSMPLEPDGGDDALLARDQAVFDLRGVQGSKTGRLFGPWASELHKTGIRVIGSSAGAERIELHLDHARKLAQMAGMTVPHTQNCSTRANLISYLAANRKTRWAIHTIEPSKYDVRWTEQHRGELLEKLEGPWGESFPGELPVALTEYVDGVTYKEGVWWNGDEFTCLHGGAEDRYTGSDGRGHLVESLLTLSWMKDTPTIPWENLRIWLKQAGYRGPLGVRVQVDGDGNPFFTRWHFGFSYDSIFGLLALNRAPLHRFFKEQFRSGFDDDCLSATVRAYLHPYPVGSEDDCKKMVESVAIRDGYSLNDFWGIDVRANPKGLEIAGADGLVGVGSYKEVSRDLGEVFDGASSRVAGLASGIEFKSDLAGMTKTWERLEKLGLTSSELS